MVALVDVAQHLASGPVPLADGGAAENLPFLSGAALRNAVPAPARGDFVGPGDGYRLQRPAGAIAIGEIFRAVEDTGNVVDGKVNDRIPSGSAAGMRLDLSAEVKLQ